VARVGRLLLALLLFGTVGTVAELLLLEHWDGWKQWVPLVLLGLALPIGTWALAAPRGPALRSLGILMGLQVLSGCLGVWFHYRGNVEFELEMSPDAAGWPLFREAMTGATPALAPGTMIWFGLLGLLAVGLLRQPRRPSSDPE
jgi:hypothetical protein